MKDTKIYLVTCLDEDGRIVVSHGVGNETLNGYPLSTEPVEHFGAKRDEAGLYIDAEPAAPQPLARRKRSSLAELGVC